MPKITMSITLNENGSISVEGPIKDKVLAYGMLEGAKDAIREFIEREAKGEGPRIAIPGIRVGPPPNGPGRG